MTPAALSFIDSFIEILRERFLGGFSFNFNLSLTGFFDFVGELIRAWIDRQFYNFWVGILKFVYLLEQIFDIFTGVTGVYKMDGGKYVSTTGHSNILEEQSFLDVLFTDNSIMNVYWYMMLGAFALCFIVTIFAVIRSMGDALGENKRPVTEVMRLSMKACLTFFLVPLACFFVIKLSSVVTYSVIEVAQNNTRICDALYSMGVGDDFKNDAAREFFSRGQNFLQAGAINYVKYRELNYLVNILSAIFMIVILMGCVIQSVLRAFALIVLFIVSPWFVATIPLDDGEKFKKWKNMFAGYALASFGPMLTMRVYLAIVPALALKSSDITIWPMNNTYTMEAVVHFWNWNGETFAGVARDMYHASVGFVLKIMILLGGAFASWRSQYLMMEVMDPYVAFLMRRGDFMAAVTSRTQRAAKSAVRAGVMAGTGGAAAVAGMGDSGEDQKGNE